MDKHMDERKGWNALREGLSGQNGGARWNRLRTGLLTAIAVMLVMSATMGSVWAYFTTYARARGSFVIHMGHEERVEEGFNSWQKTINISSTADSRPVYIRARAFCAKYDVSYSNSQNWTRVGDWMYYNKTLQPGTSLADVGDQLKAQINNVPKSSDPTIKDGDTFNVIVVYETTEVQYDANGDPINPVEADWNAKVDTSRTSTELGGED